MNFSVRNALEMGDINGGMLSLQVGSFVINW